MILFNNLKLYANTNFNSKQKQKNDLKNNKNLYSEANLMKYLNLAALQNKSTISFG